MSVGSSSAAKAQPDGAAGSVLDEVRDHYPLFEGEHIRIPGLDRDFQPVVVVLSDRLDPGELLNAPAAARAEQGLVDAEVVRVAMDEHHRLAQGERLGLEQG